MDITREEREAMVKGLQDGLSEARYKLMSTCIDYDMNDESDRQLKECLELVEHMKELIEYLSCESDDKLEVTYSMERLWTPL